MQVVENSLAYQILNELAQSDEPVGSNILSLNLAVPPATVGRALMNLESQGYLEKQSNKGRILTVEGRKYLEHLSNLAAIKSNTEELVRVTSSPDTRLLLDILSTRRLLESECAYLAAQRITGPQLTNLKNILERQEKQIKQGFLGETEDLAFHQAIAHYSGNEVMERVINIILTTRDIYHELSYIRYQLTNVPEYTHRPILKAIGDHDPDAAAEAMRFHLDVLRDDVIKYFPPA